MKKRSNATITASIVRLAVVLSFLFCCTGIASAQVTSGTILGSVRDKSGSAIAGAQVTITETEKGTSQQLVTDGDGNYISPFLIPGTYSVTVEKAGFRKQIRTGLILQVDQKARVDIDMEVGDVSETTNVVAQVPLVHSESAELGAVIEERAVRELPLNGRNFATLVYLVPGITPGQAGENLSGASTFNPRGASNFNALGHHANSNAWLIDGIDNNEYTFNTVIVTPSIESVREFKVLAGTFSAEFGRGAGVVSVSTKSGSNDFHGTIFDFLRNQVLDARNAFATKQAVPVKPPFRRNQFGAAIGGPLGLPRFGEGGPTFYSGKNRTFFFVDYAGLRELRGLTFTNTVPTEKTRRGDFSDYRNRNGVLLPIYNPLTTRNNPNFDPTRPVSATNPRLLRDQFQNNIIPPSLLNQVGLNVASIYPFPNVAGLGNGNFDNYISVANRVVNENAFNFRLDHKISDSGSLFFRYNFDDYKLDAPQGQAACCLPTPPHAAERFELGPFVAGIQNTKLRTQGAAFSYTYLFSPTFVNEFRTGFARTTPQTLQSDFGKNAATSLGILGINVNQITTGLPNINVQDFTGLSGGPAFLPVNPRQTHYQFEDNVYWTLRNHTLKFGYRYLRRLTSPFTHTNTRGSINFNNNFTNDPTTNVGGSGIATLLIGYSTGGSRGFLIEPYYTTNQEHAAFVQDDYKVNSRLTLNLGVRYEVYMPDIEIRNRLVNFDRVGLKLAYAGEDGVSRTAGKETRHGNLGPRIGFAWDLLGNSKTILRGGYGISHYPEPYSASNLLGINVPFTISQNFAPETNPLGTAFLSGAIPLISRPFPAVQPIKPKTTAELNAANPSIIGHAFSNLTPYAQSFSLNIERQITNSIALEVGYAGSRGIHIPVFFNINEVLPGPSSVPQADRRLIQPLKNVATILIAEPQNMSTFHSLQTMVTKRFSQGLQFLVSYTFGKSLDFGGSPASGGGAVGGAQTYTDIRAGRGPSGYDVKHRAVVSYLYELPFGPGRKWLSSGALGNVIGGWQISGITTLSTGRPFTVFLNSGVNNGAPSWPNRIADGRLDEPTADRWFDITAFQAPPLNAQGFGGYGNSARGVLYAPGQVNFDTSLAKDFKIYEQLKLRFQFDAFNLFNTPSFGFPNANIGSPTAGRITSTVNDNRILQFALKLDW